MWLSIAGPDATPGPFAAPYLPPGPVKLRGMSGEPSKTLQCSRPVNRLRRYTVVALPAL